MGAPVRIRHASACARASGDRGVRHVASSGRPQQNRRTEGRRRLQLSGGQLASPPGRLADWATMGCDIHTHAHAQDSVHTKFV